MPSQPVPRKTIAIDIDDVLAANAEAFVEYSNKKWGTHLVPDDYTEHWAELWSVDLEEVEKRRDTIIEEKLFTSHKFYRDAKPTLKKLKKAQYRLIVASSRGPRVQADTISWIKKEYGNLFDGIYFADMWGRPDLTIEERLKGTKVNLLKSVKADYLIDDQPKHCIAAAKAGVTAILFGDYRWSRNVDLLPNMVRAKSWQEVLEYFNVN